MVVTRYLPSGLNATVLTWSSCSKRASSAPPGRSQIRAVRSQLPVAKRRPSGLKEIAETILSCPSLASSPREAISHTRAEEPPFAAKYFPSELKATAVTHPFALSSISGLGSSATRSRNPCSVSKEGSRCTASSPKSTLCWSRSACWMLARAACAASCRATAIWRCCSATFLCSLAK